MLAFENEGNSRGDRGRGAVSGRGRGPNGTGRPDGNEYGRDSRGKENEFESSSRGRGGGRGRGQDEGRGRGGGGARPIRDYNNDGAEEPYDEPRDGGGRDFGGSRQRSGSIEFYGRGRGPRAGGGGRGGFTRKREFDRQSGSDKRYL